MTERLTDKNPCIKCDRPIYCGSCQEYDKWVVCVKKKLAEYENAEEEGRLVVLPCKIGTPVFQISYTLSYGEIGDKDKINYFISQKRFNYNDFYRLGKTVFLAREKAERALENLENVEP